MKPFSEVAPEIARAHAELERQDREVQAMVDRHGDALVVRPPSGRWSVAEHLQHIALVNGPYLRLMKAAVRDAEEAGVGEPGRGPYRDPMPGRLLVWLMEPPPKLRTKTLKEAIPREGVDLAIAVRDFERAQAGLRVLLDAADGLDLGRIRFESPFARWLPLTVDQGIRVLLAHNRRHLWLAREAMADAGLEPAS